RRRAGPARAVGVARGVVLARRWIAGRGLALERVQGERIASEVLQRTDLMVRGDDHASGRDLKGCCQHDGSRLDVGESITKGTICTTAHPMSARRDQGRSRSLSGLARS